MEQHRSTRIAVSLPTWFRCEQAFRDGQKWALPLRAVACIGFMLLRVDEKSGTGKLISVHSALTENLRCTIQTSLEILIVSMSKEIRDARLLQNR
jgi:hypothetical protein